MASNARFAEVAALAGDPARAGMLHALMDGRALTASELAHVAGITPQTASSHLARMIAAGLLSVEKQGRHRYHRLASPAVAQMMESIMQVASDLEPAPRRSSCRPARCGAAGGAHLLRPSRRPSRRGAGRRAGGRRPRRARARRRPRHRRRASPCSAASASMSRRCRRAAARVARASCAGPASTGASGGRIWPARSARRCARTASPRAGSAASTARAPSPSRPRASASSARSSARGWGEAEVSRAPTGRLALLPWRPSHNLISCVPGQRASARSAAPPRRAIEPGSFPFH